MKTFVTLVCLGAAELGVAFDAVEDVAVPGEHGGAVVEQGAVEMDGIRCDVEAMSAVVGVEDVDRPLSVQGDEVVDLVGVFLPRAFDGADRAGRDGFLLMNDPVDGVSFRK